jgi:hypothetical protein
VVLVDLRRGGGEGLCKGVVDGVGDGGSLMGTTGVVATDGSLVESIGVSDGDATESTKVMGSRLGVVGGVMIGSRVGSIGGVKNSQLVVDLV